MSRQNSREVSSLEVTLNGSQIEIDPFANGTKPFDDVKVMLLKGEKGDQGDPANLDAVAPEFSDTTSYAVGDFVIYNDSLYKCTTAHTGAWNASDFRETTVAEELESGEEETAEYRYEIVTKSTGNYDASITVKKYINEVLDTSTDYLYSSLQTPVNFDGHFTIGYANTRYTFTLLDNSTTHTTGYTQQWMYNASVDFSETFVVDTRDMSYLAPAFATSVSYAVGDLVTHEGKFYKCTTAHSAGAWNDAHFTETSVDSSFVHKYGDTMTGALTVQGNITSTGSITDGTSNVLSNKLDKTSPAVSVGHSLGLFYDDIGGRYEYDGSASLNFKVFSRIAFVNALHWSATVDADGYYTCQVGLEIDFNTYIQPIISLCGNTKNTLPTDAQKSAYNLCDIFHFTDGVDISSMVVKAKTKPTESFSVLVTGFWIGT